MRIVKSPDILSIDRMFGDFFFVLFIRKKWDNLKNIYNLKGSGKNNIDK